MRMVSHVVHEYCSDIRVRRNISIQVSTRMYNSVYMDTVSRVQYSAYKINLYYNYNYTDSMGHVSPMKSSVPNQKAIGIDVDALVYGQRQRVE